MFIYIYTYIFVFCFFRCHFGWKGDGLPDFGPKQQAAGSQGSNFSLGSPIGYGTSFFEGMERIMHLITSGCVTC